MILSAQARQPVEPGINPGGAVTGVQGGAFALQPNSHDAAFVVTLPPGACTGQATGRNNTTGTALVEVYLVP